MTIKDCSLKCWVSIYEGNQPCDNLEIPCMAPALSGSGLTATSFNPRQSNGHCTFPNCLLVYKQLLCLLGIASPWSPFSLFSFTPYLSLAVLYASCYLHQFGQISKCWRVSNCFKEALEPSQAAVFISFLLLCFILFFK